jgi:hypothetical protein
MAAELAYVIGLIEGMVLGATLALLADRWILQPTVRGLRHVTRRRHGRS